jgi:hypothetical protein
MKRAGPKLAIIVKTINAGSKITFQCGETPYQSIRMHRITKLIEKSTSATTLADIGTIRRGKYTLLIRFAFPTRLFDASDKILEKRNQGSIPAKTRSA